jgi:hypothetical protein
MSSQTISRAVVQRLAVVALVFSVGGTAVGAFFTAVGLDSMGSLLTVGSLLLFMVVGFVTGALVATSICLWRAAQRLPPTSLSPEAVAQEEKLKRFLYPVVGVIVVSSGMLGGVVSHNIWAVIGGLGFIVIYWLTVLYLLYIGYTKGLQ